MNILWTIIIGFIAGVIAKLIMPGDKAEPKGFILTTILGIIGAFMRTLDRYTLADLLLRPEDFGIKPAA